MGSSLARICVTSSAVRIVSVVVLTALLSGWDTCNAFVSFSSCPGPPAAAQISSLAPDSIPGDLNSVPLTVTGSDFTPQSQILWNGSTLQTTFIDSHHLQTTITRETIETFGGASGENVRISVRSQASGSGCPHADSETRDLVIE